MDSTISRVRDAEGRIRIWRVTWPDGSSTDVHDEGSDSRESHARAVVLSNTPA